MVIKVKNKIGKAEFEFQFDDAKELDALHKAAVIGNPPSYCQLCSNREIFKLDSNKDKEGNIYVNVICKCGAKAKLGQYKVGGYFWHKFEVYQPKDREGAGQPSGNQQSYTPEQVAQEISKQPDIAPDEVPF